MSIYEELKDKDGNILATFSSFVNGIDYPNIIVVGGHGKFMGYDENANPIFEDVNEELIEEKRQSFAERVMKIHAMMAV